MRTRIQKHFHKPSKTKQAFKHETDINNILKKYNISQLAQHVNNVNGNFGDFSNVSDFQSSMNAIIDAQNSFDGLPAQTRKMFNNNPAELIDFMSNQDNYDQAAELGLLTDDALDDYKQKKQKQHDDAIKAKQKNDESNDDK